MSDDVPVRSAHHLALLAFTIHRSDGAPVALDDAKVLVERVQLALRLHFTDYAALTALLQATEANEYSAVFPFVPYTMSDVLESGSLLPHELENLIDVVRRTRALASLDGGAKNLQRDEAPPDMPVDLQVVTTTAHNAGSRVVSVLNDDGAWFHQDNVQLERRDDRSRWWLKVDAGGKDGLCLDDHSVSVRPCGLMWARFVEGGHRLRMDGGAFCHDYSTAVPEVDVKTMPLYPELLAICAFLPEAPQLTYVDSHLVLVSGGNREFAMLSRKQQGVRVWHYRKGVVGSTRVAVVKWRRSWWPRCKWREEPVAAYDHPKSRHLFALPLAALLYRHGLEVTHKDVVYSHCDSNDYRLTNADEIDNIFTLDCLARLARLSGLSDDEYERLASLAAHSVTAKYTWAEGDVKPFLGNVFKSQLKELSRLCLASAWAADWERQLVINIITAPPGVGKTFAIVQLLIELVREHGDGARPFVLLFVFSLCNVGQKLLADIAEALDELRHHVVLSHYERETAEQWHERCMRAPDDTVRVLARFTTVSSLLPRRGRNGAPVAYDGVVMDECEATLRFVSTAPILKRRDKTRDELVALCGAPSVRLVQLLDRDAGLGTRVFGAEIALHCLKRARHHNRPVRRIALHELRMSVYYKRKFITLPPGDEMFAAGMLYELVVRRGRNVIVSVSSKEAAKKISYAFRCIAKSRDRDDADRERSGRVLLIHGDSDTRTREALASGANAFLEKHQPSLLIYTGTLGRGTSFDRDPPHFHDVVQLVYSHVGDDEDKQAIDRARTTLSQLAGTSRIVYVMPCNGRTKPRYDLVRRVGLSSSLGAVWHAINDELASRYAQDQSAAKLLGDVGGAGCAGSASDSTVRFDLATDTRPHLNAERPATFLTAVMIGLQRLALELKPEVYLQDIEDTNTTVSPLHQHDPKLYEAAKLFRLDEGEMTRRTVYLDLLDAPLSRDARATAAGGAPSESSGDHHKVLALKTFGWWDSTAAYQSPTLMFLLTHNQHALRGLFALRLLLAMADGGVEAMRKAATELNALGYREIHYGVADAVQSGGSGAKTPSSETHWIEQTCVVRCSPMYGPLIADVLMVWACLQLMGIDDFRTVGLASRAGAAAVKYRRLFKKDNYRSRDISVPDPWQPDTMIEGAVFVDRLGHFLDDRSRCKLQLRNVKPLTEAVSVVLLVGAGDEHAALAPHARRSIAHQAGAQRS
jgi:hypothetical protein